MAKILFIDDEVLLVRSVTAMLTRAGHQVVTADNGRAGLEAFDREKPDIVITDIIMPELAGVEVIQTLRQRAPKLPIIAISGGGRTKNMEFLRVADRSGATASLRKPFAKEQLFEALDVCIRGMTP